MSCRGEALCPHSECRASGCIEERKARRERAERDARLTFPPRAQVLIGVSLERDRQDLKWGPQSHPDGTHERYESQRDRYRQECEDAAISTNRQGDPAVTWRHIFLEKVFEAMAETDPEKLRVELIQALAVGTAWVEDLDRRGAEE